MKFTTGGETTGEDGKKIDVDHHSSRGKDQSCRIAPRNTMALGTPAATSEMRPDSPTPAALRMTVTIWD